MPSKSVRLLPVHHSPVTLSSAMYIPKYWHLPTIHHNQFNAILSQLNPFCIFILDLNKTNYGSKESVKIAAFRYVTPCSLVEGCFNVPLPWGQESVCCPEDGGSKFAQHVDAFVPTYTASLPTSYCCEDLKPRNKIFLTVPSPYSAMFLQCQVLTVPCSYSAMS